MATGRVSLRVSDAVRKGVIFPDITDALSCVKKWGHVARQRR